MSIMSVNVISTKKAPGAVGPYSQGIKAGDFLFASGQIAINPESGKIAGSITAQAEQCMKNAGAILEAAGASYDAVVKTTVYISNMNFFGAVNEVYAKYFHKILPARSCVEVSKLPKDAMVEVEVIAYLGK
jgi:2-iminobutanoate/2-iminopropanoate deaminase